MDNSFNRIFKIILPIKLDKSFFYLGDNNIEIGDLVEVPFGRQKKIGVVWEEVKEINFAFNKLKAINFVIHKNLISREYREFILYFASYNLEHIGQILNAILQRREILEYRPSQTYYSLGSEIANSKNRKILADLLKNKKEFNEKELRKLSGFTKTYIKQQVKQNFLIAKERQEKLELSAYSYQPPEFSDIQQNIIKEMKGYISLSKFSVNFLNGITGSGKTEVYFAIVAEALLKGKQVLVLLPEILLTKQFIDKFEARFKVKPYIWHSQTSLKDKKKIWHGIVTGQIKFLIGARSSLFLPFKDLGLIVVDEEHDGSYKQEDNLVYHARDMAVARGFKENFPIILSSASPSLESKVNIELGKYREFKLEERFGEAILPDISIIDLKKEKTSSKYFISETLKQEIEKNLRKKEQILVFLNRRGYAPLQICKACGYKYECENCSTLLVEHKRSGKLLCHHCGFTLKTGKNCLKCDAEDSLISYGPGVERIREELLEYFPESKIALITSDETKDFENLKKIFQAIEEKKYDIILGTQIIAKGHHFKDLSLACVIDGDIGSEATDLRATEKMFHLLQQVTGRAGRESKKGRAIIQCYNVEATYLEALKKWNIEEFYQTEIEKRKRFKLPPFTKFIAIIVSSSFQNEALAKANQLANFFGTNKEIQTLGPTEAPLARLKNKFRYRLLLKLERGENIYKFIKPYLERITNDRKVNVKIDVDPMNFS